MSKDMLGPIVRALVAVPNQHHGVVLDFVNKLGGEDADDVRKRVALALRQRTSSAPKVEEPAIDTLIHVDREAPLRYPDWKKDVLHPELEHTGPADYDLADIVPNLWLHDGQKDGKTVRGQIIYDHLVANNMLESCLGLADGLAIQQKGIKAYRQLFGSNVVFLWRSAVRGRDGRLLVPYLIVFDDGVELSWLWLDDVWLGSYPAARFAS
jgi:hypothetical protein